MRLMNQAPHYSLSTANKFQKVQTLTNEDTRTKNFKSQMDEILGALISENTQQLTSQARHPIFFHKREIQNAQEITFFDMPSNIIGKTIETAWVFRPIRNNFINQAKKVAPITFVVVKSRKPVMTQDEVKDGQKAYLTGHYRKPSLTNRKIIGDSIPIDSYTWLHIFEDRQGGIDSTDSSSAPSLGALQFA